MSTFRVPYPREPERRQFLFDKANRSLSKFGRCEGTPESGYFEGKSPLGSFAGTYRAIDETEEIELTIEKKPMLVPTSMIQSEARRFVAQA